ncbi:MAG: hypothetical protein ACYTFK_01810 [Planctomycetota bacterium]|jgi:hypothetical protein
MDLKNTEEMKKHISKALFVVSLVLAILMAGKVLGFAITSVRTAGRIEKAVAGSGQDDEAVKINLAKSQAVVEKIKEKNLFAAPKPKPKPPSCSAILGSKALINGKWYGVGDEAEGAKISAIGPREVTIIWEEEEKKLYPFAAPAQKESGRSQSRPDKKEARSERPARAPRPEGGRRGQGRFGRGGRGRLFENMSEEERSEMREKVRNMSREERREFFRQRREEFDSQQD